MRRGTAKEREKKRKLETQAGQKIELEREYGICLDCGYGLFPFAKREELELLPGKLTPSGHERLVPIETQKDDFSKL